MDKEVNYVEGYIERDLLALAEAFNNNAKVLEKLVEEVERLKEQNNE